MHGPGRERVFRPPIHQCSQALPLHGLPASCAGQPQAAPSSFSPRHSSAVLQVLGRSWPPPSPTLFNFGRQASARNAPVPSIPLHAHHPHTSSIGPLDIPFSRVVQPLAPCLPALGLGAEAAAGVPTEWLGSCAAHWRIRSRLVEESVYGRRRALNGRNR